MAIPPPAPGANRLLARLPDADRARLLPHLHAVPLKLRQVLYKALAPIDYVYFPTSGVVSTMAVMEDGRAIEVTTIGNEGVAGLSAFVGGFTSPNEVMVQVEGEGWRMPAEVLEREARPAGPLRQVLSAYLTAFQIQITYSVACNGLHKIEQRCCRWLLMTADRVGAEVLPLTHEFLAIMLGVQRSSLTEVLLTLQQRGLIRTERGKIILSNRANVEGAACECYRRVQEEFARVLP